MFIKLCSGVQLLIKGSSPILWVESLKDFEGEVPGVTKSVGLALDDLDLDV